MDRKHGHRLESDLPLLQGAMEEPPTTLEEAREQASRCTRCPLYLSGTQIVFGEGPADAEVMFVGEQPGDKEDLAGRPFVGPAGRLFDTMLAEVGIDRGKCYVTNAVKHFKYEQRGKLRWHKRPNAGEVEACRWWFRIETALVKPRLFVALGATAAQTLTGNGRDILKRRGGFETSREGHRVFVTVHPSSLLRIPSASDSAAARGLFRDDLVRVLETVPGVALAA